MFPTANTTQVITPFGSGYVPAAHIPTTRMLPSDLDGVVVALRVSLFNEILRSLRSSLSVHPVQWLALKRPPRG
jgi:hypothetical protein